VVVERARAARRAPRSRSLALARLLLEAAELRNHLGREDETTESAFAASQLYMSEFHLHAARRIFECMTTVRAQVQAAYERQLAWHAFRALRVAWSERRTRKLAKRQRLRYYLAVCARLKYLERGMPLYHAMRTKWQVVQRWLALCENHYAWVDPALPIALRRRRLLYVKFGHLLEGEFLLRRHYPYEILGPLTSTFLACFHRWQTYVQLRVTRRGLSNLLAKRQKLRVKLDVLNMFKLECGQQPTALLGVVGHRRINADIERYRSSVLAYTRRDLPRAVRVANRRHEFGVKYDARNGPSFKRFLRDLRGEAQHRLELEQALLLDAFTQRGKLTAEDYRGPIVGNPQVSSGKHIAS
jgi:hypothetical protein